MCVYYMYILYTRMCIYIYMSKISQYIISIFVHIYLCVSIYWTIDLGLHDFREASSKDREAPSPRSCRTYP